MTTFRPQVHIGLGDIEVGLYQAAAREDELPTTRKAALALAVETALQLGLYHIEDFEDEEAKAKAVEHAARLFPELA